MEKKGGENYGESIKGPPPSFRKGLFFCRMRAICARNSLRPNPKFVLWAGWENNSGSLLCHFFLVSSAEKSPKKDHISHKKSHLIQKRMIGPKKIRNPPLPPPRLRFGNWAKETKFLQSFLPLFSSDHPPWDQKGHQGTPPKSQYRDTLQKKEKN